MGKLRDFFLPPSTVPTPVTRDAASPTYQDIPRGYALHSPPVSVAESLSLASVYRCVSILATLASSLDIYAVRGGKPVAVQPPLIRKPNINSPRRVTLFETVASLALYGEAFWLLQRDSYLETPINIAVLNPIQVTISRDDNWNTVYEIATPNGELKKLAPYQIHHLKLLRIPGYLHGVGPIQSARSTIRGSVDLETYAGSWWNINDIPEGILRTDQEIGPDQAKKAAQEWSNARRERRTAVMGKGLDYSPLLLSPKDALWLEGSQYNTIQVARMFGVPATLLDAPSGDTATYANQTQKNQALLDQTLRQYLDEIEDSFGEILPLGTLARFNTDELLRLNEKERAETDAILIQSGQRTINELRVRDGLDPLVTTQEQVNETSV
jgi:HK97 family phage portal protein